MQEQPLAPIDVERLESVLDGRRREEFSDSLSRWGRALRGRTLWHVNSEARGGGVAELLRSLLPYIESAGVTVRWLVIDADDAFFEITKQIHHLLHDAPGDGSMPGDEETRRYERTLAANLSGPADEVRQGDVVVLHDPQVAGLAPSFLQRGCVVIWACHIGADQPGRWSRAAWDLLLPYVADTHAQVFSRPAYVWEGLRKERVSIIPPCIDVCSPKNAPMSVEAVRAVLAAAGIVGEENGGTPSFVRRDGSEGVVRRRAEVVQEEAVPPAAPIVLQVSRWDPLKDMSGVLTAFADHVAAPEDAHLLLVGPALESVGDDPESRETFSRVRKEWEALTYRSRARIHLVCLPMQDLEENATVVNAIQRRADVVVQKSLAEGFGLTVAEAMWKERPMVGSRVGGIQDQIVDGESGTLVGGDDLVGFGRAVRRLLDDRDLARSYGNAARERVFDEYLAPRNLQRTMGLIERLIA